MITTATHKPTLTSPGISNAVADFARTPLEGRLATCSPDEFLRWWFDHATTHALREEYERYYPNYFSCRNSIEYVWRHYSHRMRHLAALNLCGRTLLDVGCGIATEALWAALRGARVTAIEMHERDLAVAKQRADILGRHASLAIELRDQNLFDVSGEFQIVYLRETFHHLEPRTQVVEKLASLISPDGVLIIEDTNGYHPLLQLRLFLARGFRVVITKSRTDGVTYLYGNERLTTPRNLNRLFRAKGIRGRADYFRLLPTALARHAVLAKLFAALEAALPNRRWLRPLYLHYSWVGRRG